MDKYPPLLQRGVGLPNGRQGEIFRRCLDNLGFLSEKFLLKSSLNLLPLLLLSKLALGLHGSNPLYPGTVLLKCLIKLNIFI